MEDIKNKYFDIRNLLFKLIEIKKHLNENENKINGLKVTIELLDNRFALVN